MLSLFVLFVCYTLVIAETEGLDGAVWCSRSWRTFAAFRVGHLEVAQSTISYGSRFLFACK